MHVVHRVDVIHLILVTFTLAGTATGWALPCAAEEPSVEGIVRQHQEWKESFTNLRLVFERRNPGQWSKRTRELVPEVSLDEYYLRNEWITADEGWFQHTMREYVAGVLKQITIYGDDGECAYRARYIGPESLGTELPSGIDVEPSHITEWPKGHVDGPLEPLERIRFGTWWLNEHDRRMSFVIERTEELDGARCAVIRQPANAAVSVWLDLDHDALPRRIEPHTTGYSKQFHVEQFRKLANGHWFPDRGTNHFGHDDPYYWKVIEVEINQPAPQSRFGLPKSGEKTRLIDRTGGRYSKIPHRPDASHSHKRLARSRSASPTSETTLAVSPTNSTAPSGLVAETAANSWLWFLLGCGTASMPLVLLWKWIRPR